MTPQQITSLLTENESKLKSHFTSQDKSFWEKQPEDKWTAGQHVIHLVQSTEPLLKALKLPKFVLKWRFGTSNRPSRSYDEVVNRYQEKLAAVGPGIVGPFSRNMPSSISAESEIWFKRLNTINQKLNQLTTKLDDKSLDTVLLPHPLMGRMTLREILMWNAYHTNHHIEVLQEKYI